MSFAPHATGARSPKSLPPASAPAAALPPGHPPRGVIPGPILSPPTALSSARAPANCPARLHDHGSMTGAPGHPSSDGGPAESAAFPHSGLRPPPLPLRLGFWDLGPAGAGNKVRCSALSHLITRSRKSLAKARRSSISLGLQGGVVGDGEPPVVVDLRVRGCRQVTLDAGEQAGDLLLRRGVRAKPDVLQPLLKAWRAHPHPRPERPLAPPARR